MIDAVAHGFNWEPSNMRSGASAYKRYHVPLSGKDPRYLMTQAQYDRKHDARTLVSSLFAESQTDMAVYHAVDVLEAVHESASPMDVGQEAGELAPGRFMFYGGVSDVFDTPRALDDLDRRVEKDHIMALKVYPTQWDDGIIRDFLLDDEKYAYPLIERARDHGLTTIAVHKAMGSSMRAFGVRDLDKAVTDFPDMNFEIVHGGWAFLEDTLVLASRPNVYINLEGTASLLHFAPRRFAEVLGRLCRAGAGEPSAAHRILWATGVVTAHPQPFLDKFAEFEIPEDLVEEYGYEPLTPEIKRRILGQNFADLHKLDLGALAAGIPLDSMRQRQLTGDLAEPWSGLPDAA